MKNTLPVLIFLLVVGAIGSTANSDTSIRYVLCRKLVNNIEAVPQGNLYSLHIALTESATEDFFRLTKDNVGKTLDIEFEGAFVTGATIDAPIKSGYIMSIPATKEEANRLRESILDRHNETPCGIVK